MAKKRAAKSNKFTDDLVSNQIIGKYGDIIESGEKVLADLEELKVLSISPALDNALGGGLREGSCVAITGDPKTGKAQNLSSTVYTTSGPKTMGDIQIGDEVCTPDGGKAVVNGVFPQGVRDVYRVTFNDDTYVDCDIEHLWKVKRNYHGGSGGHYDWQVLSLKEILSEGLRYSDRPKWSIPLTSPVQFEDKDQPIPAYTLGCLLGDGGITSGSPIITSCDGEIVSHFMIYAHSLGLECKPTEDGGIDYKLSHPDNKAGDNKLTNFLRELNLWGCGSHDKFIPDNYKYGSVEQRLEIIKGLMDTDGYNDKGKNAEYATVSEKLAYDVSEVLQSLGYISKIKQRVTKCNGKEFPSYRLHISGHCVSDLFSLQRKIIDRKRIKPTLTRTIKGVKRVNKEECQCIMVDHPDHLYLTDNFTVTHNTTTALYFAAKCQALKKKIFYCNTEGRITKENFNGIKGLDASKIKIIQPTDKTPVVSAETYLNSMEAHIKGTPDLVMIVDSVSSMVPQDELDGEVRTGVRNALPRLMSMFLKRISGDVARNKAIIIFITHNIANTGGSRFSPSKMSDSGNMLQYQISTNMVITHRGKWEDKDGGADVGQVAHWKIKTSAAGGIPMTTVDSWIKYGVGIDETKEIVEMAIEFSMIKKSGSWYTITDAVNNPTDKTIAAILKKMEVDPTNTEEVEKAFRGQGVAVIEDIFNEHPSLVGFIQRKIGEVI